MSGPYHIVVCGSLVPDPLQTLEPIQGAAGPALKNESMLPSVLDPWAAHALYEAAHLAKNHTGSKVWLVSLAPKPKLQQLMMNIAQKAPFELVALDGSASGFNDPCQSATELAAAIKQIAGLDFSRLLLFGGCASASRDAGVTMQIVGEKLGIQDQFLAVDELTMQSDGSFKVLERVEGGQYQISVCQGPPAVVGWATGNLPEPPNNPQIGMLNMRSIMPALQKATPSKATMEGIHFTSVELPKQTRQTKLIKDLPPFEVAREIVDWIKS